MLSPPYSLAVLMIATSCLYADQNLMAPHLSAIAQEFGFNDEERDWKLGGMVALSFFVAGAPATLVIGRLSDHINRIHLLCAIIIIGELPVLMTYWVTSYWQLLLTRTITGVSVGGVLPLVFSILGDMYTSKHRILASGVYGIASGLGAGVGQLLSGALARYGWRIPFVVIAIPSLLMAGVVLLTLQDPPRGSMEHGRVITRSSPESSSIKTVLSIQTNRLALAQGLPGCIPWGVCIAFLNDFLAVDRQLGVLYSTFVLSWFGVGVIVGQVVGGVMGQKLYNIRPKYMAIYMGLCTTLAVVPMFVLVNSNISFGAYCFVALLAGTIAASTGPNIRTVLLNVNTPDTRGTIFALFSVTDDLGKGLGPLFASVFILYWGRLRAFNVAICAWLVCGFILLCITWSVEQDEVSMHSRLLEEVVDDDDDDAVELHSNSFD